MSEFLDIKSQVESSESEESIETGIITQLKIADEILEGVKNFPELELKFRKEYEELRKEIIETIKSEKIISNVEYSKIKLSFEKLNNEKNNKINDALLIKDIKEYSKQDAELALKYLQNNYKNYKNINNFGIKSQNKNIKELQNIGDVNLFQKDLLNIIYKIEGDSFYNKGFNDKFLAGFDKEKGNYVISIESFRKKIFTEKSVINLDENNPNNIDYIEYKNYLSHVQNLEGMNYLGENNVAKLEKYFPKHIFENLLKTTNLLDLKFEFFGGRSLDDVKFGEYMLIADMLNEKDHELIKEMEKQKISKEEILKHFIKKYKNKGLENKLTEYKKINQKYYDEETKKEHKLNKGNIEDTNNNYSNQNNLEVFERYDGSKYYRGSGKLEYKNEILILNRREQKIIESDPSNLDNIINFYEIFKDLNMLSVWDLRSDLIDSMGDNSIKIDAKAFSLDDLVKIGNHLINFLNNVPGNKQKLIKNNTLGGVKNELRKFSGANTYLSDEKTVNIYGDDPLEGVLRELGIIGNALGFKKNKFGKIMNGETL